MPPPWPFGGNTAVLSPILCSDALRNRAYTAGTVSVIPLPPSSWCMPFAWRWQHGCSRKTSYSPRTFDSGACAFAFVRMFVCTLQAIFISSMLSGWDIIERMVRHLLLRLCRFVLRQRDGSATTPFQAQTSPHLCYPSGQVGVKLEIG
ncbi:hypothetical protein BR93DRAFT_302195 [Coniochaeta sp. PMI_546]|nr:hypothetical protein BR93DRAFT_302195 [Coniochaeta sp. PMI_546]